MFEVMSSFTCPVRIKKNKHHKDKCVGGIGLHLHIELSAPHGILKLIGRTYVFN